MNLYFFLFASLVTRVAALNITKPNLCFWIFGFLLSIFSTRSWGGEYLLLPTLPLPTPTPAYPYPPLPIPIPTYPYPPHCYLPQPTPTPTYPNPPHPNLPLPTPTATYPNPPPPLPTPEQFLHSQ